MQPSAQEYQKLLTEIIQKLFVVFGPAIVLAKVKSVSGLDVSEDGAVTAIHPDPAQTIRKAIDSLKELSSEAVDKIIEPLSAVYPGILNTAAGKTTDIIDAKPNIIMPAPVSAPIANEIKTQDVPPAIITTVPMPAPVPLATADIESSNPNMNQLNIAGQGNG